MKRLQILEQIKRHVGSHTGSDPGPFAPPAGHTIHIDGVLTRIRVDPDDTVDVFRWPLHGSPTSSVYELGSFARSSKLGARNPP